MVEPLHILAVDKLGYAAIFLNSEGEVEDAVPLPPAPHEIQLTRDGRSAFISIYGSGIYKDNPSPGSSIAVLDLASRSVKRTIDISPYSSPHGLTLDADGTLWASCDAHSCVLAISPESGVVESVVPTGTGGTHWVLATPDRRRLFTSNKETPFLCVIDPVRRSVVNRIAVPNGSEGICFSPDGRWLYAADHRQAAMLIVDCEREEVAEVISLDITVGTRRDSHHMRIKVSPDGLTVAVSSYHHDVVVLLNPQAPGNQTILKTGRGPMAMLFHPADQNILFVSNHEEGTISLVDVAGGSMLRTFPCGAGIESMEVIRSGETAVLEAGAS